MKTLNIILILAIALVLTATNVYANPKNTEKNDKKSVVFIEVYNPETDKMELRACPDYPDCEGYDLDPPSTKLDKDIEEQK